MNGVRGLFRSHSVKGWGAGLVSGLGRCRVGAADVSAGCMLAVFFIAISQGIFVRTRSGFGAWGWSVVGAGLLLLTLARVFCWLYFLSLLATVRGGTSFLCRGIGSVLGCCCVR